MMTTFFQIDVAHINRIVDISFVVSLLLFIDIMSIAIFINLLHLLTVATIHTVHLVDIILKLISCFMN